jgi:hypothetical protein
MSRNQEKTRAQYFIPCYFRPIVRTKPIAESGKNALNKNGSVLTLKGILLLGKALTFENMGYLYWGVIPSGYLPLKRRILTGWLFGSWTRSVGITLADRLPIRNWRQ